MMVNMSTVFLCFKIKVHMYKFEGFKIFNQLEYGFYIKLTLINVL